MCNYCFIRENDEVPCLPVCEKYGFSVRNMALGGYHIVAMGSCFCHI